MKSERNEVIRKTLIMTHDVIRITLDVITTSHDVIGIITFIKKKTLGLIRTTFDVIKRILNVIRRYFVS